MGLTCDIKGNTLAISTDDSVKLFDIRRLERSRLEFREHGYYNSKAITFSPHEENTIVTGGGGRDRTIKIWSTNTGRVHTQTQASGQITGLHYLGDKNTIFAAEGLTENRVSCWALDHFNLTMVAASKRFETRVLYSAQNPSNPNEIVTACPDSSEHGTINFWSVQTSKIESRKKKESNVQSMFQIR